MPEKDPVTTRIKHGATKTLGVAAFLGVSGLALTHCNFYTHVSEPAAQEKAAAKYDAARDSASPAGKFLIQYLRVTNVAELDQSGLLGDFDYQFNFGDACLEGSSYDIAGGDINASANANGLFSSASASVEGRIPTAAAYATVDKNDPNSMTVKSGHTDPVDLHFTNVAHPGRLVPSDDDTRAILQTYGCANDVTIQYTSGIDNDSDHRAVNSPWIQP